MINQENDEPNALIGMPNQTVKEMNDSRIDITVKEKTKTNLSTSEGPSTK